MRFVHCHSATPRIVIHLLLSRDRWLVAWSHTYIYVCLWIYINSILFFGLLCFLSVLPRQIIPPRAYRSTSNSCLCQQRVVTDESAGVSAHCLLLHLVLNNFSHIASGNHTLARTLASCFVCIVASIDKHDFSLFFFAFIF